MVKKTKADQFRQRNLLMDEKVIGKNIKQRRLHLGFSLAQLAKLSRFTKGYVSKIENSSKTPPLGTLAKIAAALNTDLDILISENVKPVHDMPLCLVQANERKEVIQRGTLHRDNYEALAYKKLGKNMEPILITPGFEEEKIFSHEGEVFLYVLEGTYEFSYRNEKYILQQGGSIYFDSVSSQAGRSNGEKKAKILAVTYSYKRN
jgi:transcriptional regulator with XRE-family HTH domain